MIKINLLESVTDRPRGGVAAVEEKVTNPVAQTILHSVIVAVLLFAGMGYDYFSAHWQKANAMAELQHQKQINDEMNAVNPERAKTAGGGLHYQVQLQAAAATVVTKLLALKHSACQPGGSKIELVAES